MPSTPGSGCVIISPRSWPTVFSTCCISNAVHVLSRYNVPNLKDAPDADALKEELTRHFNEDNDPAVAAKDDWLMGFLSSTDKYEPRLFLETLYFSLFWADYIMQQSDEREMYMPKRNDGIRTVDVFLAQGLGYGKKTADINKILAARSELYGQDPEKSVERFITKVRELVLCSPEAYGIRAHAYISMAVIKTLIPIFFNWAPNEKGIHIRCRKCKKLIAPVITTAPVIIRCRGCGQQYTIDSVWGPD